MHKLAQSTPAKLTRFCVEGNIACGKTSVISQLTGRYKFVETIAEHVHLHRQTDDDDNNANHIIVSPEPVELWSNVAGMNLLEAMYQQPRRWSFTFENYAQLTRFNQMKAAFGWAEARSESTSPKVLQILERSIFSNRYCFIENFKQSSTMEPVEFGILDQCFENLIGKRETNIDHFIYLQTKPEVVYERLKGRARQGEETIPLDYLSSIHQLHEQLFVDKVNARWAMFEHRAARPKVTVIDANRTLPQVFADVQQVIDGVFH